MKPRHQIKFKPVPKSKPRRRPDPKAHLKPRAGDDKTSSDVTSSSIQFGERQLHLARALSDSQWRTREQSLTTLRDWLTINGSSLDAAQMDRLWKALFYCVWMADKRPFITAAIANIVSLGDVAGPYFLSAFFRCMSREWAGLDRHRLDKFYELINAVLTSTISQFIDTGDLKTISDELVTFLTLLREHAWPAARKGGVGMCLHILDVYHDRLMTPVLHAITELGANGSQKGRVYDLLLEDILLLITPTNPCLASISKRVRTAVLQPLTTLVTDEKLALSCETQRDLIERAIKCTFAIAGDKRTAEDDRKALYELSVTFKAFVSECNTEAQSPSPSKSESDEE